MSNQVLQMTGPFAVPPSITHLGDPGIQAIRSAMESLQMRRIFGYLLLGVLAGCGRSSPTATQSPVQSSGAEVASFKATDYAVFCVTISPDGKTVAIGGSAPSRTPGGLNEGIIKVYDISSQREKATLWQSGKKVTGRMTSDTRNHVGSLAFSPDGKILVGGDQLGYRLWDVSTGKELMFLPDGFAYTGAAFSPDGKTLAVPARGVLNERGVRLVEVATGHEVGMLPLKGPVFCLSRIWKPALFGLA
jgi:WD40 repeat protein